MFMNFFLKKILPLTLIYSLNAYALVDYSEKESTSNKKNDLSEKSITALDGPRSDSKSLIWKSDFSLNANYETLEIETSKIGLVNLNTHLQTPFNIYLDMTYWSAQSANGSQNGNPKGIIGFNWIRFGSPHDEARLDLYVGGKFKGQSEFASSRNDKIFGAETTKRFGAFGLGLSYESTITGTPCQNSEMSIGNIQKIAVSGGWMVSQDIQFELEAESFTIGQSGETGRDLYLEKSLTFATISPKLNLNLAPAVNLEMGARFRTKKIYSDQSLANIKILDLHGAYSNSLFAGLNLTL